MHAPLTEARLGSNPVCCSFVPPHVLDHVARTTSRDSVEPNAAQRTAIISRQLRDTRRRRQPDLADLALLTPPRPGKSDRQVYDTKHNWDFPGAELVRGEGDAAVVQENANEAYDFSGAARVFYHDVLNRESIDNAGMTIHAYVNFGVDFDNAFWDGEKIALGNGDNTIFVDFAKSPDVMGHELTHGVVQYTANLEYFSQSGALNEHFADAFGSLIEQHLRGQDAGTANWLIGDEIMAPDLYGEALRSMAIPGTAYDNPILGKDPQPAHMKNYYSGPNDNQGVHINSGIFNRAFYLVSIELGTGNSGRIWYAGLQNLWSTATFLDAADVMVAQARLLARENNVPRQAAQTVRGAFREVGVL